MASTSGPLPEIVKVELVPPPLLLVRWIARRRPSGRARAAVLAILAVVMVSGDAVARPALHAQWRAAPADERGTPGNGDDGGNESPANGTPGTPADFLAHIPKFGTTPPAQPITVPFGPTAPSISRIPTSQPVAFLTIDDGWTKVPEALPLLKAAHVPVTLFLTINAIRDNPEYFKHLQASGAVIEAHTITHINLKGRAYEVQKKEACGSADQLGALYGRRPALFRPPFGDHDSTTLRAVRDCGMKASFMWKETVNTGIVRYQTGHKIEAGDIILMHFRPAFVADFLAALQAIHDAGLTPALLENYIA